MAALAAEAIEAALAVVTLVTTEPDLKHQYQISLETFTNLWHVSNTDPLLSAGVLVQTN